MLKSHWSKTTVLIQSFVVSVPGLEIDCSDKNQQMDGCLNLPLCSPCFEERWRAPSWRGSWQAFCLSNLVWCVCVSIHCPFSFIQGELHCRSDSGHHGQKGQHPEYVCYCPCGSWEIHPDRLLGLQSWNHRLSPCWWNSLHWHKKRWAGEMHHHQVHVSLLMILPS